MNVDTCPSWKEVGLDIALKISSPFLLLLHRADWVPSIISITEDVSRHFEADVDRLYGRGLVIRAVLRAYGLEVEMHPRDKHGGTGPEETIRCDEGLRTRAVMIEYTHNIPIKMREMGSAAQAIRLNTRRPR